MTAHYRKLLFTPQVQLQQTVKGSRVAYVRGEDEVPDIPDGIGEREASFIATRDSFYLASVGETGWPYIQHRGGATGFVNVLNNRLIGFADYRGNRQYISLGNVAKENRVSLFFMDYARRGRLKLLGRMRAVDLNEDPALAAQLIDPHYDANVERGMLIDVEAFDWNCSQHITPRFVAQDFESAIGRLQTRIAELEAENHKLRNET
jgi:uncharacterized protein